MGLALYQYVLKKKKALEIDVHCTVFNACLEKSQRESSGRQHNVRYTAHYCFALAAAYEVSLKKF